MYQVIKSWIQHPDKFFLALSIFTVIGMLIACRVVPDLRVAFAPWVAVSVAALLIIGLVFKKNSLSM